MRIATLISASFLAASLALTGTARANTAALPPLSEVREIDGPLFSVALAIEISDRCERIAPRNLKGLLLLNDLNSRARSLGYSKDEIDAYVNSSEAKARMRARGETYVKSQGLDPENPVDLCSLGKAEIARNSQIGALLKEK
ncbi:DUF5333 domain-containing protein [Oceanicola sp. S124]|uniref:DUF5333 domain-containing protein n=1 Tax=Oceanicola sp. S124 TaxID=1042378 RepID=UPI0002559704|nr:DUF5333 domain-containing protein [Oceanicola sp. S124]